MKILIRIVSIFVVILIISTIYSKIKNKGEVLDTNTFSKKIPPDYFKLLRFRDSCCVKPNDSVEFVNTTVSKYRNPISCFFIDKNYYLQAYKIDTSFKNRLANVIKISSDDASLPYYTGYFLDNFTNMEFLYKATKPQRPDSIYFDLYGEKTKTLMKNDTILYYFSKCNSFSLRYSQNESFDIYGQPKKGTGAIDMEIMFLKQQKNLFMLIFSGKDADASIKPGTLYSIFFK